MKIQCYDISVAVKYSDLYVFFKRLLLLKVENRFKEKAREKLELHRGSGQYMIV